MNVGGMAPIGPAGLQTVARPGLPFPQGGHFQRGFKYNTSEASSCPRGGAQLPPGGNGSMVNKIGGNLGHQVNMAMHQ
eukprot:7396358-Karenia_brevis.AAC.1